MNYYLFGIITVVLGCNGSAVQKTDKVSSERTGNTEIVDTIDRAKIDYTGPAAIVYKTNNNYNNRVPVTMNDIKTKIVSYPAPQDLFYNGRLAVPTELDNGYLLDNRGINKNVAFLRMTYETYSQRKEAPSIDSMMQMILDRAPLVEMYDCGNRTKYKDGVNDLNKVIENGELSKFRKIF